MNKVNKDIIILGIESSCDDTSVGISRNRSILSNVVCNQKVHMKYGGVVPELASREHLKNIIPTIQIALRKANITLNEVNAIAFTKGPGMMGSLLVGASFAKSLSLSLKKPLIAINHMEAHVLANFIDHNVILPCICLTASGGHTQLVSVKNVDDMKVVGETLDDSAGETFDKCAKMLGLSYPGGPQIEKYASLGNKNTFKFTIPKVDKLNFSFSGLKTNILQLIQKESKNNNSFINDNLYHLCASIQNTIVEILIQKLTLAIKQYKPKSIAISGGVAANKKFRQQIKNLELTLNINSSIPKHEYSTDNGAMIAIAGYYKYKKNITDELSTNVNPRLKINYLL